MTLVIACEWGNLHNLYDGLHGKGNLLLRSQLLDLDDQLPRVTGQRLVLRPYRHLSNCSNRGVRQLGSLVPSMAINVCLGVSLDIPPERAGYLLKKPYRTYLMTAKLPKA